MKKNERIIFYDSITKAFAHNMLYVFHNKDIYLIKITIFLLHLWKYLKILT